MFCDNQGMIACTQDPQHHTRMKHIDIRYHFIRNCVQNRLIDVIYILSSENIADLLTKPLGRVMHQRWIERLGLDCSQGGVLKDGNV
jgi:hypothetical protein